MKSSQNRTKSKTKPRQGTNRTLPHGSAPAHAVAEATCPGFDRTRRKAGRSTPATLRPVRKNTPRVRKNRRNPSAGVDPELDDSVIRRERWDWERDGNNIKSVHREAFTTFANF